MDFETVLRKSKSYGNRPRFIMESIILVILFLSSITVATGSKEHVHDQESAQTSSKELTNITCPVMSEMKASPNFFTEYQGKKVYFCCSNCISAFNKEPEKYLAKLPQFASVLGHDDVSHNHGNSFNLALLIKPFGIATLSLIVATVLAALFRKKKPKLLMKWHKRLGMTTAVLGLIHAILVILIH